VSDDIRLAAALLVGGPVIGALCLTYPPFFRVWLVGREEHLAMVAAHQLAWRMVNLGFVVATILTIAGLGLLTARLALADGPRVALTVGVTAVAAGGLLWCVVLAVRTRTTPELARLVAADQPTEPAESILGAALGGLFAAFVWTTSLALLAIVAALLAAGSVAPPVALVAGAITLVGLGSQIRTGDTIPAILYLPTVLLGVALLAGWT
jgi:hypothetical protein